MTVPESTRRDSNKAPSKSQDWSTARCHRLIRPLTSKLHGLKNLLALPSISAVVNPPKEVKTSLGELPYIPSHAKTGTRKSRRGDDRALFFGDSRPGRRRVPRTYSSSTRAPAHQAVVTSACTTSTVYGQAFPAAAIDFDGGAVTRPVPGKVQPPKESLDPLHPRVLLQSLRPNVKPEVFQIYTGIYAAFENILTSTTFPLLSCEVAPLKVLAARRIAVCILATDEELDSDDVWYDSVGEIGVAGEYRREIVRWHAIELVRDAMCSNLLPSRQKNGLGLPGVLVGLCRSLKANAEAESLLKTLMELYPLSESVTNPSLVTLTSFWRGENKVLFQLLGDAFVDEGNPILLGNITVNRILKQVVDDMSHCELSRNLVTKALEAAFGIWGKGHVLAAAKRHKKLAKRKGSRRSSKITTDNNELAHQKPRSGKPMSVRIGERAEEMAFHLTEKLVAAAQSPMNTHAMDIISNLTRGFLLQDEAMRATVEDEWLEWYPIAAKVAILLQSLGREPEDDAPIVGELARCLDDLREDDLKSLGEFVAACYENLYTATGQSITGEDEVNSLVKGLISYATTGKFPPRTRNEKIATAAEPMTPFKPKYGVIIFTPGKKPVDPQQEKERYYITRLALNVANGFSSLDSTKHNEKWNQWQRKVVHQIIGLKVRTPTKPVAAPEDNKKERKGWRFEEGISEWVEVGGTPGGALLKGKKKKATLKNVELPINSNRQRNWSDEYEKFSDLDSEGEERDSEEEEKKKKVDVELSAPAVAAIADSEAELEADSESSEHEQPSQVRPPRSKPLSPTLISQTDFESEDPDTSFSRLFDNESESFASSASEYEEEDDGEDGKYYAPTPALPPSSVRRSPRSAGRIKRSLHSLSAILPSSSPMMFSRAFTPLREEGAKRKRPTVTFSSPSPASEEEEEEEEKEEEEPQPKRKKPSRLSISFSSPSPSREEEEEEEGKPQPKRNQTRAKSTVTFSSPPLTSEEEDSDEMMEADESEGENIIVAPPKRTRPTTRPLFPLPHNLRYSSRPKRKRVDYEDEDEDEDELSAAGNGSTHSISSGRGRKRRSLLCVNPKPMGRRLRSVLVIAEESEDEFVM